MMAAFQCSNIKCNFTVFYAFNNAELLFGFIFLILKLPKKASFCVHRSTFSFLLGITFCRYSKFKFF